MSKLISVVYTGGTVGMEATERGLRPATLEHFSPRFRTLPGLGDGHVPRFDLEASTPILDSARMTPRDWLRLASGVADNYERYDGFLLIMGTDTMSYAASALSFFLENLRKPVVITGAQRPLVEPGSDAPANLLGALQVLEQAEEFFEVAIYFGGNVVRGNRSTKVSAEDLDGITSPRFPVLGRLDEAGRLSLQRELLLPKPAGPFRLSELSGTLPRVSFVRIFPGMEPELLECALSEPTRGLVLEMYGSGAAPEDPAFLGPLERAARRGVTVVSTTQCLRGRIDMDRYRSGYALRDAGVISGGDMTTSAAYTKLIYLLACGYSRQLISDNLRGELTSV